jgi:hypothetical protein
MLASVAGLGLVGHQAGFISWDMEGVDLGFTQVAYAGTEFGHPAGDTAELLRRAESTDAGAIPAVDPFSVLERRALLAPKGKVAPPKAARLGGDSDQVVQAVIETREHVLDSCIGGTDCADPKIDDLDHEVDDELILAAIKDDLPGDDDVEPDGHEGGEASDDGQDGDGGECNDRGDDRDVVDHEGDDGGNGEFEIADRDGGDHESGDHDGGDHESDDRDGGDHDGGDRDGGEGGEGGGSGGGHD